MNLTNNYMSGVLTKIGEEIFESGRLWRDLHKTEALAVLRYVISVSSSKDEICEHLKKINCEIFSIISFEEINNSLDLKESCLSLIGITAKNGELMSISVCEPKKN